MPDMVVEPVSTKIGGTDCPKGGSDKGGDDSVKNRAGKKSNEHPSISAKTASMDHSGTLWTADQPAKLQSDKGTSCGAEKRGDDDGDKRRHVVCTFLIGEISQGGGQQ